MTKLEENEKKRIAEKAKQLSLEGEAVLALTRLLVAKGVFSWEEYTSEEKKAGIFLTGLMQHFLMVGRGLIPMPEGFEVADSEHAQMVGKQIQNFVTGKTDEWKGHMKRSIEKGT